MAKILKNTTASIVDLTKFGVTIPASGQITVVPQDYPLLAMPLVIAELTTFINAGTVVVNNGLVNLAAAQGIDLLSYDHSQGLKSATTFVESSQAAAPSAGQALVATGPSTADWSNVISLNSIEVSDTSAATTTSGTDALMTTMSITASPGTYLVWFSCDININTAGAAASVSLYNNGVQIPETLRKIAPFDGGALSATTARGAIAINKNVVITTGALQVRWSVSNGTATAAARTFNMLRIA